MKFPRGAAAVMVEPHLKKRHCGCAREGEMRARKPEPEDLPFDI